MGHGDGISTTAFAVSTSTSGWFNTTSSPTFTSTFTIVPCIGTATLPLPYNLSLSAVYQGDWNNSNIDVYTYTRNVGTLLMTWTY